MQIIVVKNPEQGIEKAKELLYEHVDKKTVLFLSGGSSPKPLYEILAKEKIIRPIAVGLIDERYGEKFHEGSNELMIKQTGFLQYLEKSGSPFYSILQKKLSQEKTARAYDERTRALFFQYPKSVAVMGIGSDGHTAGLPPSKIFNFQFSISNDPEEFYKTNDFVTSYTNQKMVPPERVTMMFTGLHLIDFFVVLVFGKEKKKALKKMLENGPIEEIPARFFNQEVSDKTVVITDQRI